MVRRMIFVFLGLFVFSISGFADDKPNGPQLSFTTPQHNYGTAYVDEMPDTKLAIEFSNTGNMPLILSNVRACCGTRVTSWPREPIAPGAKDTINIEFRLAQRAQRISRTVTVTSNSETNPTAVFRIAGEIIER